MFDHLLQLRTTRHRALAAVLALTLVSAACGGDDDATVAPEVSIETTVGDTVSVSTAPTPESTTATPPTTPTTDPTTDSTRGSTTDSTEPTASTSTPTSDPDGAETPLAAEAFCRAAIETQGVLTTGPEVDFETATEEDIASAMEEYGQQLLPVLDDLSADVPDELADDVESMSGALRDSLESGAEPFSEPEFVEADRNIDAFMLDNCGYEVISVDAVDYRFENAPATVTAGTVGFEFQNSGTEVHEMILFRIDDDVDLSVEELLELPEEEAESMIQFLGAAVAESGEEDVIFADLEPGRHAMLCFIPLGTTSMEMLESESPPEGPPHFTQGMVHEFEVT